MLSNKCKYALRSVLYLSIHATENHKLSVVDVANGLKTPKAFTGKILQELVKAGVISSAKGPNGGFYLKPANKQKPILAIVHQIDGLDFFNKCGLGLSQCSDSKPCPLHNDFKKLREELHALFKNTTIAKLSEEILSKNMLLTR